MEHIKSFNEHFTIGDKIKPNVNPTNVYKLVISNMSGDADAYKKTKTFLGKDQEPLIKDLIDLCKWSQSDWPRRDDIKKKYREIINNHKIFEEDLDPSDIITNDVTTDHQYICRPSVVSLTWFDENGEEHSVSYK